MSKLGDARRALLEHINIRYVRIKNKNVYKEQYKGVTLTDLKLEELVRLWFNAYKRWEKKDNAYKAFKRNRLTVRRCNTNQVHHTRNGLLNVGSSGIKLRQNPDKFTHYWHVDGVRTDNLKEEEGLYGLPAVLMICERIPPIQQEFSCIKTDTLFMPLGEGRDLRTLYRLKQIAKKTNTSSHGAGTFLELIDWVKDRITRLSLASSEDMKSGLFKLPNGKVKTGYGSIMGNPFNSSLIRKWEHDALYFQSKITKPKRSANNEVIVKYRHHAGKAPWTPKQVDKMMRAGMRKDGIVL